MTNVIALPLPVNTVTGEVILRLPRVKERTGFGRASIYAGVKNGTFPAPIKLGERAVGWLASSVDAWIQSRVQASRKQVAQ
ncbi:AlpA family transcriptional regulator [Rugamonas sp.]|uniref:helix-turn-helix transcriptional regulator n=1 Tax=Rugamonas sp. TaxID=1926287 RepID=UPI0025F6D195|nr:AlpA family transcriptional regulator [Rugamonas sp.]